MADIKHLVEINASAPEVYEAVTTEKGLSGWWTKNVTAKPEEGSIAEFGFMNNYYKKMKIISLKKNKYAAWECLDAHPEWVGTKVIFSLEENDGKTILHFDHSDWANSTDMYAMCNFHWGRYMQSLKDYCETGKGNPHVN